MQIEEKLIETPKSTKLKPAFVAEDNKENKDVKASNDDDTENIDSNEVVTPAAINKITATGKSVKRPKVSAKRTPATPAKVAAKAGKPGPKPAHVGPKPAHVGPKSKQLAKRAAPLRKSAKKPTTNTDEDEVVPPEGSANIDDEDDRDVDYCPENKTEIDEEEDVVNEIDEDEDDDDDDDEILADVKMEPDSDADGDDSESPGKMTPVSAL